MSSKNKKRYSVGEEIFNSVSHGVSALGAIVGCSVMVTLAACFGDLKAVLSSLVFGLSLIVMYTMSTLYHAFPFEKVKKIFGIAVMRTNGVKVSNVQLFIRAVLGKYTFEIMLPVFSVILLWFSQAGIFSIGMIALILIVQIAFLIGTRKTTRSAIHDLLSDTVTVDLASQLIFDTQEELIKYKEEQHAKMVTRSPY